MIRLESSTRGGKDQRVPIAVVTGVGKRASLGGSVVAAGLKENPAAHLVALGRATRGEFLSGPDHQQLAGEDSNGRLHYIQGDLLNLEEVDRMAGEILTVLDQHHGRLAGVFLSHGTGYVERDIKADPRRARLMEMANVDSPIRLARGLKPKIDSDGSTLAVAGAAFMHPTLRPLAEDGVRTFLGHKKEANRKMHELFPGRPLHTVILPGIRGAMVEDNVHKVGAELAWFAGLPSNQYAPNGIGSAISDLLLNGMNEPGLVGATDIRMIVPGLGRMILGQTTEKLAATLPGLIQKKARQVMEAFRVTREEYEAIVADAKEQECYGPDFPYDEITYDKLKEPKADPVEKWLGQNGLGLERGKPTPFQAWVQKAIGAAPFLETWEPSEEL